MDVQSMQNLALEKANAAHMFSPSPKKSMAPPIPTIMEESYSKEKTSEVRTSFEESPKLKPGRYSKLNKGSSSSALTGKSLESHHSLMIQNNPTASLVRDKTFARSQSSLVDNPVGRTSRKFGTFAHNNANSTNNSAQFLKTSQLSQLSKTDESNLCVDFLDKEDWKSDVKCNICTREFKKINGVFEHHCRVCGEAVCGECSSSKINDNRVCDVCLYKVKHMRAEDRRKNLLKSKRTTIRMYTKQLAKEKDELDKIIKDKYELGKKVDEDKDEQSKHMSRLQKEKDKNSQILTSKKETNIKLKESLAIDKTFLKDKEIEYEELRNKINALKVQIGQKKNNLETKKEELKGLSKQKANYLASPSFVNLMNDNSSFFQAQEVSTMSIGEISNHKLSQSTKNEQVTGLIKNSVKNSVRNSVVGS